MKITWCWRCQMDYPMVEDHEWSVLMEAHSTCFRQNREAAFEVIKQHAAENGLRTPIKPSLEHPALARAYWYLVAGFELFTGVLEDSPNPIWHHYVAHYGPPCKMCGKLLRTKRASYCAACGAPANPSDQVGNF